MVTATLTPIMEGLPAVEVFFTGFDDGVHHHTISRIADGRTMDVRGGWEIAPDVAVLDYEAPLGVSFRYVTESFDEADVSLGFSQSDPITLSVGNRAFVHQPLNPRLWVSPVVLLGTATVINRPMPADVVYVEGDTVGRRIGSGRQGIMGLSMSFQTMTLDDADAMQSMLGSYESQQVGVLCVRVPPPMRVPRTFFASVRDGLDEINENLHRRGTVVRFDFTADEVAGPYPGLVVPLLTYDDLDAAYPTYDVRDGAYASYTDMDRDYSLAGYAGGS